jgi:hypothetical protein
MSAVPTCANNPAGTSTMTSTIQIAKAQNVGFQADPAVDNDPDLFPIVLSFIVVSSLTSLSPPNE